MASGLHQQLTGSLSANEKLYMYNAKLSTAWVVSRGGVKPPSGVPAVFSH